MAVGPVRGIAAVRGTDRSVGPQSCCCIRAQTWPAGCAKCNHSLHGRWALVHVGPDGALLRTSATSTKLGWFPADQPTPTSCLGFVAFFVANTAD